MPVHCHTEYVKFSQVCPSPLEGTKGAGGPSREKIFMVDNEDDIEERVAGKEDD
jgi:hypothetical protein